MKQVAVSPSASRPLMYRNSAPSNGACCSRIWRPAPPTLAGRSPSQQAHLVNEDHAWDDLRLPLLPPLRNLAVYLLPHLGPDFPGVPRKQSQEPLLPEPAAHAGQQRSL